MVQFILCEIRRCDELAALKMILTVLFIIVCLALAVIILLQESKSSGLGAISGAADTYWGKNKGRSMEGKLEKGTKVLVILFFIFAILLNVPSIADPGSKTTTNTTTTNSTVNNSDNSTVSDTTGESSTTDNNDTTDSAEDTTGEAAE